MNQFGKWVGLLVAAGTSLIPRSHPPQEEKGLVKIRHPVRPSDVSHLACEMTNHSTVRVISSAVRSHVA